MHNLTLVYPMMALIGLTFLMLFFLLILRVKAVQDRKVSPRYFKLNQGDKLPDNLTSVSQNYSNLLELPVLFYISCTIAIILQKNIDDFVVYAWIYVALRYVHSYIHTTYNNVLHRLFIFGMSCVVLIIMWVKLALLII